MKAEPGIPGLASLGDVSASRPPTNVDHYHLASAQGAERVGRAVIAPGPGRGIGAVGRGVRCDMSYDSRAAWILGKEM